MNVYVSSLLSRLIPIVESKVSNLNRLFEEDELVKNITNSNDPEYLSKFKGHKEHSVRHAVASNPSTKSSDLSDMEDENDDYDHIQKAIAVNPNTNPHTLKRLFAKGYDTEALSNPALPLHLLERPDMFQKGMKKSDLEELAQNTRNPQTLHILSEHPHKDVRGEVTNNDHTSPHTLSKMAHNPNEDEFVHMGVASHSNTPVSALEHLYDNTKHDGVKQAVVGQWNTPQHILMHAATTDLPHKQHKILHSIILKNPKAGADVIDKIIKHPDTNYHEKEQAIMNPNTSKDTLQGIHNDFGNQIKEMDPSHPSVDYFKGKQTAIENHKNFTE